jgi:hypothetical protein
MVYRDLDPREVLIEVIGDIEDAKVRLSLAEAKMVRSGLTSAGSGSSSPTYSPTPTSYGPIWTR